MYRFERDTFPEVISIGNCVNIRNCRSSNVDLADGWCVNCWDKGADAKINIQTTIKQREEEKKSKLLLKEHKQSIREKQIAFYLANPPIRGRHRKGCQCKIHTKKGFK